MKYLGLLLLSMTLLFGAVSIEEGKKAFESKDYKKAHEVFFKVAQDGMVAKFNLGQMYEAGLGVQRDLQKALEFYLLSANEGFPKAQVLLGNAYLKGIGVPQNLVQAEYWYKMAASQGEVQANKALENIAQFRATLATVTIRSNVFNDEVYLNGQKVGTTKMDLSLPPNQEVLIEVKKAGFKTYSFKGKFKAKEKRTLIATLNKK